jgi:CRP-like cAMP-binding protein
VGAAADDSLLQSLREVPGFDALDERELARAAAAAARRFYPAGSFVFEKGEDADGLYVILSGRIRILDEGGEWPETAVLGPGHFFGEVGLLLGVWRTRSAEAVLDTDLLVIPQDAFTALVGDHPEVERAMRERVEAFTSGRPPLGEAEGED